MHLDFQRQSTLESNNKHQETNILLVNINYKNSGERKDMI